MHLLRPMPTLDMRAMLLALFRLTRLDSISLFLPIFVLSVRLNHRFSEQYHQRGGLTVTKWEVPALRSFIYVRAPCINRGHPP